MPGGAGALFSLAPGPVHGSVRLNGDGTFVYTPYAGFVGTDSFTIRYTKEDGSIILYNITMLVSPKDPASSLGISMQTEENQTLTGNLNALGFGGITAAQVVREPRNSQLVLNADGTFTLVPDPDFSGQNQFTLAVTDQAGNTFTVVGDVAVLPAGEE
ncbi:Ig-like domain-containing protein [Paenibacillus donghaensis]|uniref:Cadherin-like domain-containing protein n=1 Tax=Paenibacillus donghaensis TaxID=414771 RepID=A0A2Z2K5K9_9BACL|nr:Ig-like domain-containing protein [Paenibacillus donghaensis]ASA19887.1 hypothetical protein B9T62_03150 [Paenibacillus donghaensis]